MTAEVVEKMWMLGEGTTVQTRVFVNLNATKSRKVPYYVVTSGTSTLNMYVLIGHTNNECLVKIQHFRYMNGLQLCEKMSKNE